MLKLFKPFLICLVFICAVFSQDSLIIDTNEQETAEKEIKLLIAKRESEFKNAVAEKVKREIEKANVTVELIGINLLKKKSIDDFDAVIIINEVRAWHLNRHTKSFLRKLNDTQREKVIMVSTAATDWKTKRKGIDAVTVASEMSNVNSVAKDIVKKVLIFLHLE